MTRFVPSSNFGGAGVTLTRKEWDAFPAEVRKKGIVADISIGELKVSKCNVRKYVYDSKKFSQVIKTSPDQLMELAATLPEGSPVQRFVEFAASLARDGRPIQQLLARPEGAGFGVVVGKRRLLGAELAKLELLPVFVKEMTDAEAIVFSGIENIHRAPLEPLEEIEAVRRLYKEYKTLQRTAERIGKSIDWVERRLIAGKFLDSGKKTGFPVERGDEKLSNQIGSESPSTGDSGQVVPAQPSPLDVGSVDKTYDIAQTAKAVFPNEPEKQRELFEATKSLPRSTLRAVLERVRENPDVLIKDAIRGAETEPLTIKITFPIATSNGLEKAATLLKKTVEDIVQLAVREWLKAQEYIGRGGRPPLRPQNGRNNEHVKAMILGLCADKHGANQSKLLKDANIYLCHKDWKGYYLPWMAEKKLIKTGTDSKGSVVYKTTPLGGKWLVGYRESKKKLEMN